MTSTNSKINFSYVALGAFPAGRPPGEGRLFSFGVDPWMINRFDPSGEQPIQIQQRSSLRDALCGQLFGSGVVDLDKELFIYGAKEPFNFPASLGSAGGGMR